MNYLEILVEKFIGTANWAWNLVIMDPSIPWYQNYFYGLIIISLFV